MFHDSLPSHFTTPTYSKPFCSLSLSYSLLPYITLVNSLFTDGCFNISTPSGMNGLDPVACTGNDQARLSWIFPPSYRSIESFNFQSTMSDFAHLLPPSWKTQITAWLAEDTPSFDYGGYVVGEVQRTAHLLGKGNSEAVLAGVPFFTEVFNQLGCECVPPLSLGARTRCDRVLMVASQSRMARQRRGYVPTHQTHCDCTGKGPTCFAWREGCSQHAR